jgi:hypothetical protein
MIVPGWTKRSPESGCIIPAAIFSSVDFPDPLRPTRQRCSPGLNVNSAASSNRVLPSNKCTFRM